MYQPTTATRPAPARPAADPNQPPRPRWRLAGREVTQDTFYSAQRAKAAGRRVFFAPLPLHDDELTTPPGECQNCLGAEYFALEIVIAGPFKTAPSAKPKGEDEVVQLRPAWAAGAWWQVIRNLYPCPLCNAKTREIAL